MNIRTMFFIVATGISLNAPAAVGYKLPVASPESVGMSSARLDNLRRSLQAEVDQGNIPGAVVMINRRGKLVYSQAIGYQNKNAHVPMKIDSIFRIYSMSKPIAAVAAMMLVEDGKLVLADPVGKYLPEILSMQVCNPVTSVDGTAACTLAPAEKPITVQDLLRHTSGIGYGETTKNSVIRDAYSHGRLYKEGGADYDQVRQVTPKEEVAGFASAPLATQPGSNWEYGMSMDLMGRVIDVAAGQPLGQFVKERVFNPLDMPDTGFYVSTDKLARLAEALDVDPFTKKPIKLFDVSKPPPNEGAGGGMVSTAPDYLNFASMLLNGGVLESRRLLSPMTLALMTSDQLGKRTTLPVSPGQLLLGSDGYTFGLGFMVRQENSAASVPGSTGEFMWAGAVGTFFWVDPRQQLAVVVMSQVPGPIRPHYRRLIKDMVSAAIVD